MKIMDNILNRKLKKFKTKKRYIFPKVELDVNNNTFIRIKTHPHAIYITL